MVTHEQISDKLDKGTERFGHLENTMVKVETLLGAIADTQKQHSQWFEKIDNRVIKLEASDNQRAGERGVWTALLKSPAFAWLVTIAAFVWAIISNPTGNAGTTP